MAGDGATGSTLNIVNWVFTGAALFIVAIRIFTRICITHQIDFDDWLMLSALACALWMSCMISVAIHYGLGGHEETIDASKYSFLAGIPDLLCQMFGRVSWAWTLLILMGTTKTRRYILFFLIAFQVIWNIVALSLSFGMCRPIDVFWNPAAANSQRCLELYHTVVVGRWQYFQTAWDTLTDLMLALFPVLVLGSLQIKLSLKIGLSILMSLGVFAAVATVVKAVEYGILFHNPRTSSYSQADIFIWTVLQADVVIIAASIPSCRPLFRTTHSNTSYEPNTYGFGSFGRRRINIRLRKQRSDRVTYENGASEGVSGVFNRLDGQKGSKRSAADNRMYGMNTNPSSGSRPTSEDAILGDQVKTVI